MNKNNFNVRETLKKIPSVDEILAELPLSTIPLDFYKFHINNILKKIRADIINGKIKTNIRKHCFQTLV